MGNGGKAQSSKGLHSDTGCHRNEIVWAIAGGRIAGSGIHYRLNCPTDSAEDPNIYGTILSGEKCGLEPKLLDSVSFRRGIRVNSELSAGRLYF